MSRGALDKDTVKRIVEGKVKPEEVDPALLTQYERAAKVMKLTMMAKLLKEDYKAAEVVPGVYLGSIGAAQHVDHLSEIGVTHVLCVGRGLPRKVGEDFTFKEVSVFDDASVSLSDYFPECIQFIEDALAANGKVLVHCFAGKSRSATVVIAYLIHSTEMEYGEAFETTKRARPVIQPNPGFCMQLVKFYKATYPDRPAPGLEDLAVVQEHSEPPPVHRGVAQAESSSGVGESGAKAFMELVEKAGRTNAILYRDEEMVIFHEKFGVCKQHLTIVPVKPLSGLKALSAEDIPLLEAQYQRGIAQFVHQTREMEVFRDVSDEELPEIVVAGFFHPAALGQLQLHMLLPPFRTERVCAYPKWHAYSKVLNDLKRDGCVGTFDVYPAPEEGRMTQEAALALHRRFKEIELNVAQAL